MFPNVKIFSLFSWKLMFLRQSVANCPTIIELVIVFSWIYKILTFKHISILLPFLTTSASSIKNLNSDKRQLVSQTLSLKNFSEKKLPLRELHLWIMKLWNRLAFIYKYVSSRGKNWMKFAQWDKTKIWSVNFCAAWFFLGSILCIEVDWNIQFRRFFFSFFIFTICK